MITYFVHSTSTDNELRVRAGWSDPPLSRKGEQQAEALAKALEGRTFAQVYSSDLLRAVQTTRIALPHQIVITDPRLREMNYGRLNGAGEGQFPRDETIQIEVPFEEGESCHDVEGRVRAFLSEHYRHTDHIAIFGHRFPQLALEVIFNGRSWPEALAQDWRSRGAWQAGWAYDSSGTGLK